MIPFIITMLVFLLGIYYLTIFLHLLDIPVFGKGVEIRIWLSLIPFYYWFKKEKVNTEPPIVEETVKKEYISNKEK